jgi:hypothetical protein
MFDFYLLKRLSGVWRGRGPAGFIRFLGSRLIRVARDVVFERNLSDEAPEFQVSDMPDIVTIDSDNLSDPEFSPILEQILGGEGEMYLQEIRENGILFYILDEGGRIAHHSSVQFVSRYKTIIGEDLKTPMFTNCWTAPQARGKRLYPITLKFGGNILAARGYDRVLITCEPDNIASVKGIKHAGFREIRSVTSLLVFSRFAIQRISGPGIPARWRMAAL